MRYLCLFFLVSVAGCSGRDGTRGNDRSAETYTGKTYRSGDLMYGVDTVANHLSHPWAIAFLPDGKMLVTERAGKVLIFQDGIRLDHEIDFPALFVRGQGGLMDIELHPDHKDNGWVYFTYAKKINDGGGTAVARARIDKNALADFQELFVAEPASESGVHFGSRLAFDGKGYLFLSCGERGMKEHAQSLGNHLGKILRLHDDGRIPDDNPFVGLAHAKPEIWSYGHRNPQGLVYEAQTETLWSVEHGPRGGDELNRVEKGKNYGWPEVTYGVNYDGTPISDDTAGVGLEPPVTWWVPSIAPCGMALVRSDRYPAWKGDLLVGALALKHIARVNLQNGKYLDQEKLLDQTGRVRAIEESPQGYLYVLTEGPGMLLKIIPLGDGSGHP